MKMKTTVIFIILSLVATTYGQSMIGGSIAPDGRYPYMAALRLRERLFCGASIINKRWLLGAAHCAVIVKKLRDATAVVGSNSWRGNNGTVYKIGLIVQNRDYNKRFVHSDDIALFQVIGNITMTKKIQPVSLPKDDTKSYVGLTAVISGWGELTENNDPPYELQHTKVKVISNENCWILWKLARNRTISSVQLCTSSLLEQEIVTSGDSGSPLVSDGVQIGLVSFGWEELPDVFTRVSSYLTWINKVITAHPDAISIPARRVLRE